MVVFFAVGLDEAPAAFVFGGGGAWLRGGRGMRGVGLFQAENVAEPLGGFAHGGGEGVALGFSGNAWASERDERGNERIEVYI